MHQSNSKQPISYLVHTPMIVFFPLGEANEALTTTSHTNMWRDQVLFIKQRQQATSDYRENPKVRWIGKSWLGCHSLFLVLQD